MSVRELFDEFANQLACDETGLSSYGPPPSLAGGKQYYWQCAFGDRERSRNVMPPRFLWVPVASTYEGPLPKGQAYYDAASNTFSSKTGALLPNRLYKRKVAVDVHIWGLDEYMCEAMEDLLITVCHSTPMLSRLFTPERSEWKPWGDDDHGVTLISSWVADMTVIERNLDSTYAVGPTRAIASVNFDTTNAVNPDGILQAGEL